MQVLSRGFLLYLLHPIWPDPPFHIRLKDALRPRPHVSGDFCICKFFYADTKISASTRSVYESYTTVHTYPIRIRTSQRISQQSMRITKKAEPAIILAPNSRLSCLFTWGFNTCELEERKKFLLKNTIKNVSIKRKTEKNQRQLICLASDSWIRYG